MAERAVTGPKLNFNLNLDLNFNLASLTGTISGGQSHVKSYTD